MVRSEGLAQHRQVPQGHLAVQPTSTAEKNAPRRDSLTRRRRRKLRRSAADFAKIVQRGLGQISPTSEKWLQATLLAKCEAGRIHTTARAAKRVLFALLAASFCDPPGGASKAGPCPNKFLKISALSGKMTVYKDSHQKGIEAIDQKNKGGICT